MGILIRTATFRILTHHCRIILDITFNHFFAQGPSDHFAQGSFVSRHESDASRRPMRESDISRSRKCVPIHIREMPPSVEYLLLALGACFFIERDLSSRIRCERTNCLKRGACARLSERARMPPCRRIRQLHTYAHICGQQGGNGAYGTHLKNISGSPSAGAHRAPARCIPRGIP